MPHNLKKLLRVAMENSEEAPKAVLDPERGEWLRQALGSTSVDLSKALKEDIDLLIHILSSSNPVESDALSIMENILSLVEDIDLANDFYKMGGLKLLLHLLFEGPMFLRNDAYDLVAYTTQNNAYAQQICMQEELPRRLIALIPEMHELTQLKHLLSAISCITRGYEDAVRDFQDANGFEVVLDKMQQLLSRPDLNNGCAADGVWAKASFLIYCLLQECLPFMGDEYKKTIADKLVYVIVHFSPAQEHLLASLVLLLTGTTAITDAIDSENVSVTATRPPQLLSGEAMNALMSWLKTEDDKIAYSYDQALAELRSYIGILRKTLNT